MEVLTVIEHESVPVLRSRGRGQKALEHMHADTLTKLEKELPAKAWSWGNQEIKFGHYCGVISLGNLSIEILPKIYGVEVDAGSSRHALVRMLSKARRLKLRRAGTAGIALQKHSLLDVFILHFCDQLHAQLMQGMIRKYIERKENLNVLRGRLRIEQQFKQNLAHRERLFCQYDELSDDNIHNQVLKYTLKILLKTAIGNRARLQVAELLMRFDPISDFAANAALLDSLSFDRSTARYESIFDQCRWFLEGVHPDVLAGKETCVSLLFDMNQLFETYVGAELRKKAWGEGLQVREQGPRKYFARRQDTDEHVFMMKPDISFSNENNQVVAIADAKWKILDEGEKKLGISQADLYQMESYASRYRVKNLFLVYPMQQKMTTPIQLTLKGSGATINILPFDVTSKKSVDLAKIGVGG
ncbi:MAG: McrC family protein [Candidatus Thiodiazotropha sp. (ex Lucinoma borealis)]|nr:McrC family protein [Candidatus Thiodiazotropha sp. (ex Lucinoma borealis)]